MSDLHSPFSPRLFVGVSSSTSSDSEAAMSSTSILETKCLPSIGRDVFSDAAKPSGGENNQHAGSFGDSEAVGLGIIDALNDERSTETYLRSKTRMVVFGSQLKNPDSFSLPRVSGRIPDRVWRQEQRIPTASSLPCSAWKCLILLHLGFLLGASLLARWNSWRNTRVCSLMVQIQEPHTFLTIAQWRAVELGSPLPPKAAALHQQIAETTLAMIS